MHIVGGDHACIALLRKREQTLVDRRQLGNVVALQLQEKPVPAKHIQVPIQSFRSFIFAGIQKCARNFTRHAGRGGDQTFGMACQVFMVDPGGVVESFQL